MARVLVIDDDFMVTRLLEEHLSNEGHVVTVVHMAEEGFELATKTPPELIMLDVNLPDATGFQMCGRFREDPRTREIPIIMMTGAARFPNQQSIGRQMGANDYILKPFNVVEVGEKVNVLVGGKPQELQGAKGHETTPPHSGPPSSNGAPEVPNGHDPISFKELKVPFENPSNGNSLPAVPFSELPIPQRSIIHAQTVVPQEETPPSAALVPEAFSDKSSSSGFREWTPPSGPSAVSLSSLTSLPPPPVPAALVPPRVESAPVASLPLEPSRIAKIPQRPADPPPAASSQVTEVPPMDVPEAPKATSALPLMDFSTEISVAPEITPAAKPRPRRFAGWLLACLLFGAHVVLSLVACAIAGKSGTEIVRTATYVIGGWALVLGLLTAVCATLRIALDAEIAFAITGLSAIPIVLRSVAIFFGKVTPPDLRLKLAENPIQMPASAFWMRPLDIFELAAVLILALSLRRRAGASVTKVVISALLVALLWSLTSRGYFRPF